jgi:hypothetical protein
MPASVEVARSDWIKDVLEPMRFGEYVLTEIWVPPVPERERWLLALEQLQQAKAQYAQGNDAGVFLHCFGAFETLGRKPEDYEKLFSTISDGFKRKQVNDLLKQVKNYLESGRHVSSDGPEQGKFAVDHRDAEFALWQAEMLLIYMAKLLAPLA